MDDEEPLLRVMARLLTLSGYQVTPCESGAHALKALSSNAFDAVISDIRMPGMNGIQLLRAARERDLDLPVLLVTGSPDLETASAAVTYGAAQYLTKPFSMEALRAALDRAVKMGRVSRAKRELMDDLASGTFRIGDRASLETRLDSALASIQMEFQPIVRIGDGRVFGYEALMRSSEPALPNPDAVLAAAQRAGQLQELGRVVRERVLTNIARHGTSDACFFVNIRPEDLLDPQLYAPEGSLTPLASRVVLELTDRASLDGIGGFAERIAALRALGFRLALDDLGAGYAGLNTFTRLDPEFVKLDSSLVRGVDSESLKQRLVESMVELCHELGKTVICEGVETQAELDVLAKLGANLAQGHLIARPAQLELVARAS